MSLADWAAEDDGFYGGEKRQRGGRKKRKKNREDQQPQATEWGDLYDPTRPTNYEEYLKGDERLGEIREWKDKLYAHRFARQRERDVSSDEDERPARNGELTYFDGRTRLTGCSWLRATSSV